VLRFRDATNRSGAVRLEARGVDGAISFDGRFVTIEKKNLITKRGKKVISARAVTAIQFKDASAVSVGFVQIMFSGGRESTGGVFDAASDENSIIFTRADQDAFVDLAMAIKEAMNPA
jgi:hypothetical protein